MTANWFECKVKYMKVDENGREKKVTEAYLLDAMSYTEAESRITHELESVIKGDYYITSLKKSNITELVESVDEADDRWYKAKIAIIDADETSGKEKKSNQYFLIAAANIDKALENLTKSLSTYVIPYEIASLNDTQFMDVFPYFSDGNDETPANLKPLEKQDAEDFE